MTSKLKYISIAIIIIISIAASVYFYLQYQVVKQQLSNPSGYSQQESKVLLEKLGKIMDLPTDEVPQIATVSDSEKLRNQPFFSKAKNGDKVIIYSIAKKAILYDPVANKIIEVAPVNIGTSSATTTSSTVKVALYNGTDTVGLTQTAEKTLKSNVTEIEVVLRDNAKNKDYEKTLIVDLNGNNNVSANLVANTLNGEISKFPEGETKPIAPGNGDVDILVILGKNYNK